MSLSQVEKTIPIPGGSRMSLFQEERRVSLSQEERRGSLSQEERRLPNHLGEES